VTSCTYTLNSTNQSSCATDGAELKQVSTGRGTVTIEIIPTSGSELFPSATTGLNGVQFNFTVTTNSPSSATITSASLASYGTNTSGETNNYFATFSGTSYTSSEIIASLAQNATSSNCSQSSGVCSVTPPAGLNSLSVSGGLLLAGSTGTGLQLTSAVYTFTTAPEPPSWLLFLVGLSGLAVVRSRWTYS
jgi:hypothetical protein